MLLQYVIISTDSEFPDFKRKKKRIFCRIKRIISIYYNSTGWVFV